MVEVATGTAVWYYNGLPPVAIRWVMLRDPQAQFVPQALLCTDQAITPTQIIEWFVLRWQMEVTLHEVRTHLGVETQRQWSDLAILRTTPVLWLCCKNFCNYSGLLKTCQSPRRHVE